MDKSEARKILGISEDASVFEINRRYDALMKRQYNARRGGNENAFAELTLIDEAYETLRGIENSALKTDDRQKRRIWARVSLFKIIVFAAIAVFAAYLIYSSATYQRPYISIGMIGNYDYADKEAVEAYLNGCGYENVKVSVASLGDDMDYTQQVKAAAVLGKSQTDILLIDEDVSGEIGAFGAFGDIEEYAGINGINKNFLKLDKKFVLSAENTLVYVGNDPINETHIGEILALLCEITG